MTDNLFWLLQRVGVSGGSRPIILRDGTNKLGRTCESGYITCSSVWVSRHHCDISVRDGLVFIKDHKTMNGTFIESSRLESDRFIELKDGDHISLGKAYNKGDDVVESHYVFKIVACTKIQENNIGAIKRRSTSPSHEPAKRIRNLPSPPSQVSSTSSQVAAIVDLTIDDDLPKTKIEPLFQERENHFQSQSLPLAEVNSKDQSPRVDTHSRSVQEQQPQVYKHTLNSLNGFCEKPHKPLVQVPVESEQKPVITGNISVNNAVLLEKLNSNKFNNNGQYLKKSNGDLENFGKLSPIRKLSTSKVSSSDIAIVSNMPTSETSKPQVTSISEFNLETIFGPVSEAKRINVNAENDSTNSSVQNPHCITSSTPIEIYKKGVGLIRKGAKKRKSQNNETGPIVLSSCTINFNSSVVSSSNGTEKELASNSSGEEFLGFDSTFSKSKDDSKRSLRRSSNDACSLISSTQETATVSNCAMPKSGNRSSQTPRLRGKNGQYIRHEPQQEVLRNSDNTVNNNLKNIQSNQAFVNEVPISNTSLISAVPINNISTNNAESSNTIIPNNPVPISNMSLINAVPINDISTNKPESSNTVIPKNAVPINNTSLNNAVSINDISSNNSVPKAKNIATVNKSTKKKIIPRRNSCDAQDVKKLLYDLEKSSEDTSDLPVKAESLISKSSSVQESYENVLKTYSASSVQETDSEKMSFNRIEEQLRSVLGESSGTDSKGFVSTIRQQKDPSREKDVEMIVPIETINLDSDVLNNSFSQGGTESVVEIDEDDITYSQIFDDCQTNRPEGNEVDENPLLLCTRIIKEEVDDMHEDADLDLFESHFSQCSQEEEVEEKIREREFLSEKDSKKIKIDCESTSFNDLEVVDKKSNSINELGEVPTISQHEANKAHANHDFVSDVEKIVCPLPATTSKSSSSSSTEIGKNDLVPKQMTGAKLVKSTLLSAPPENKTKRGRGRPPRKAKEEPSATKDALLKRQQERLKEERKSRLKNLALQNKSSSVDNKVPHQNNENNIDLPSNIDNSSKNTESHSAEAAEARKVVKITERNRSTILLEGILANPEPIKRRGAKQKQVINDSTHLKENRNLLQNENLKKSCLKVSSEDSTTKKVRFSLNPDVRYFECEGTMERTVNSAVSKDKAPLRSNPAFYREIPTDEFIINVLHWNPSWRMESKIVKGDPPVHKEVFNTKEAFVSYTDYKRWLYPLLLYELWANMMKQQDEMESMKSARTFNGIILLKEERRSSQRVLLTLKCCVPLLRRDIATLIDPMDVLLISVKTTGKKCLVMYGIVMSQVKVCNVKETTDPVARTYLTKLSFKPDVCAYFDVVIYNSPTKQVENGYYIKIHPTYNMWSDMRHYESLVKLRTSPLLDIVIDPEKNCTVFFSKDVNDKLISSFTLNDEQKNAVLRTSQTVFSNKPSISLIHGPPGTGKTRVIVALVEQILYRFKSKNNRRQRILLCAQTNTAIDEICLRLLRVRRQLPREKRFKLTRFGKKDKVHAKLSDILTTTIARKEVEKMNLEDVFALELSLLKAQERMVASALESTRGPDRSNYIRKYEFIQAQIKILDGLVNKTASEEIKRKEIDRLVSDEELKVIYHSDIIATTLGSCASKRIVKAFNIDPGSNEEKGEIGVCIVDEATQATDPATLLPLLHDVKHFILVGDPQQLPPMVNSETCKKSGLSRSLFSRLYKVWSKVDPGSAAHTSVPLYRLNTQYRMHPEIAQFPSMNFYNNELVTPEYLAVNRGYKPYAVITHKHMSDPDCPESNAKEAELLINFVDGILLQPVYNGLSIAIIVPYQKQRTIVTDLVREKKWLRLVTVNTIDSYQGQEKDVVILTCVRTNGLGFLTDYQRTNVAITRAMKAMYILANFSSLQADQVWKNLLTNAQTRGTHLDINQTTSASKVIDFVIDKKKKRSQ